MVLERPLNGWVNIHICDFKERASYLTDVPIDILQSLIAAYNHHIPAAIKFDAEGWEWILIIDDFDIHIITDDGDYEEQFTYCNYEIDRSDFTQKVISDILRDIDDWAAWSSDIDDANDVVFRKGEILRLIKELKGAMKNKPLE